MPAAEAAIPVVDDGLVRGDGVFEVIRVYDGRPYALADHLDRMERSIANLRLQGGAFDRPVLGREVGDLLDARGGRHDGCLRIMLTAGGHRILLTEPLPPTAERIPLAPRAQPPPRPPDRGESLPVPPN